MQRAEFYVEGGGGGGGGTEGFGGCAESCLTETAMNKDAAIKRLFQICQARGNRRILSRELPSWTLYKVTVY